MKILQLGRYPPPYGGITVHIQRLTDLCRQEGIECHVLDLYRREKPADSFPPFVHHFPSNEVQELFDLWRMLRQQEFDVVHVHTSTMGRLVWMVPLLEHLLRSSGKVLTIHHGDFVGAYQRRRPIQKLLIRRAIRMFDAIVLPTVELRDAISAEFRHIARRLEVISSFIQSEDLDLAPAFEPFDEFAKRISSDSGLRGTVLISGFGFRYYGFDLLAEALEILSLRGLDFGVIINFYGSGDVEYKRRLADRMRESRPTLVLEDLAPSDFLYVLRNSDLYVRPTYVDSCGVTVYEAMMLGVQTIASDVCTRPEGVLCHQTGDASSLAEQIVQAVNLGLSQAGVSTMGNHGGGAGLINLYRSL